MEENEPIPVYDTSGPFGDNTTVPDIHQGIRKLRQVWIDERQDSEPLPSTSSSYTRQRLADESLDSLRFQHLPEPRKAKKAVV